MLTDAPQAYGIEVLHGKPKWVHGGMTTGASRILAMHLHLFPQGKAFLGTCVFFQFGHVFGRILRRCTKQVVENPLAAFDGGSTGGIGSYREDTGMG